MRHIASDEELYQALMYYSIGAGAQLVEESPGKWSVNRESGLSLREALVRVYQMSLWSSGAASGALLQLTADDVVKTHLEYRLRIKHICKKLLA